MSGEHVCTFFEGLQVETESDRLLSRMEAVLFLSREPISVRRLALLSNAPEGTRIRTMVKKLNILYEEHSRAFRVYEVAKGFQLRTQTLYAPWLARFQQIPIEICLSSSALETLAIIAWQQPVLRATIEKIRGVQCGEMLKFLMELDLVKIVGKSNDLGHPFLYGTTRIFLNVFGLNDLGEMT